MIEEKTSLSTHKPNVIHFFLQPLAAFGGNASWHMPEAIKLNRMCARVGMDLYF